MIESLKHTKKVQSIEADAIGFKNMHLGNYEKIQYRFEACSFGYCGVPGGQ